MPEKDPDRLADAPAGPQAEAAKLKAAREAEEKAKAKRKAKG